MSRADPNILLIRFGRIGDIVLSSGVANAIKKTFPSSSLTLLTDEKARDLTCNHESLDNVICWNRSLWKKIPKISAIFNIIKEILNLRRNKFDVVIDLQGFFETALIAFTTGAKKRVGYNEKMKGIFYNVKLPLLVEKRHDFTMQLKLAEKIGVDTDNVMPSIKVNKPARDYINLFLTSNGIEKFDRLIGINPCASADYKRWNEKNFSLLADKLIEKYNVQVIIFWGPGEEHIAKKVKSLMVNNGILCCRTNLMELSAFIERCELFITNDSGPMHISACLGVPTFAIFIKEHSDPDVSGPIGNKNKVFVLESKAKEEEIYKVIEELTRVAKEYCE